MLLAHSASSTPCWAAGLWPGTVHVRHLVLSWPLSSLRDRNMHLTTSMFVGHAGAAQASGQLRAQVPQRPRTFNIVTVQVPC